MVGFCPEPVCHEWLASVLSQYVMNGWHLSDPVCHEWLASVLSQYVMNGWHLSEPGHCEL